MRAAKRRKAPAPRLVSAATSDLRPPPALRHGLTSRRLRDAMRDDVEALIPALIGAAYPDPTVVDAARAAAEAILHLHHVRHARRSLIDDLRRQPAKFRGNDLQVLRTIRQIIRGRFKGDPDEEVDEELDFINGTTREDDADLLEPELTLASIIAKAERELRNMADYERRAVSGRGRALRRLTLAKIEAERRQESAREALHMRQFAFEGRSTLPAAGDLA
jgi:hypothetical protein